LLELFKGSIFLFIRKIKVKLSNFIIIHKDSKVNSQGQYLGQLFFVMLSEILLWKRVYKTTSHSLWSLILLFCNADVNECELKDEYPCYGICENTIGSYSCTCPSGTRGNAYTKDGCQKKDGFTLAVKIVIGKFSCIYTIFFSAKYNTCLERRIDDSKFSRLVMYG
jgi:hypothetical protein